MPTISLSHTLLSSLLSLLLSLSSFHRTYRTIAPMQGCTISGDCTMLTLPTVDGSVDLAFLDAATLGEWEKRINAAKVAVPPSAAAAAAAALARSHALAYTSGAEEGSAGEKMS